MPARVALERNSEGLQAGYYDWKTRHNNEQESGFMRLFMAVLLVYENRF